jgi:hypothetical protein
MSNTTNIQPVSHEGLFDDAVEAHDALKRVLGLCSAMVKANTELEPIHKTAINSLRNCVNDAINETLEIQRVSSVPKEAA